MAVLDKYVNADVVAQKAPDAHANAGSLTWTMASSFEVAADDDDGSIYRIIRAIEWNLIVLEAKILNDVITGGIDYDLGLYRTLTDGIGGEVLDADALAAAMDMAVIGTRLAPKDGLSAIDIADQSKRLLELAGQTIEVHDQNYDIAFTANTVGSIAGTIAYQLTFLQV